MSQHDSIDYGTHVPTALAMTSAGRLVDAIPLVVWTADADGTVDYANRAWSDLFGRPEGETAVRPEDLAHALHPDDLAGARAAWHAAVAAGTPLTLEFRVRSGEADYRWQLARARPIRAADGSVAKWCGILTDVHDRKIDQDKLRALAMRLNATLESITDALLTFDYDWRFTYVNHEGERVLQMTRTALIGRSLWDVFPQFTGGRFEAACRRAMGEKCTLSVEEWYEARGVWLEIRIYPAEDGLAVYFRDISDRKRAELQAREEARIQSAIVAAQRDISAVEHGLQTVLELTAQRAQDLTGAQGAVVALVDGEQMVYHAGTGLARGFAGLRFGRSTSLAGAASMQEGVVVCPDTELDARADRSIFGKMGARSAIVVPLRSDKRVIGVVQVIYDQPQGFGTREINNFQILVESLGTVIERHRVTEQLLISEQQYRLLFDRNPNPIWVYDADSLSIIAVNAAAIRHYGYSEQQFLAMNLRDLRPPEEIARLEGEALKLFSNQAYQNPSYWRHRIADGSLIDVEVAAHRLIFNGRQACMAQISDITARVRAERELQRVNRSQRMLNACNEVLMRAQDELVLLTEICRIAVEVGGYRMGWIGYAQDDDACSVVQVAQFGEVVGYFDALALSWSDINAGGHGPVGRAIRSGEAMVVEDVALDPGFAPWREAALQRGYRSVVCLPLAELGRPFGSLNLYAAEHVQFGADELHLLQSLANDLTYGVAKLRAQAEQRRMHDAILKVAAGVSGASGTTFFEQLARHMAEALEADAAVIAQVDHGQAGLLRTIATVVDGRAVENFSYAAAGTPCQQLFEGARQRDGLMVDDFGTSRIAGPLAALAPQAYVGRRLLGSGGQLLGVLFVLFRQPASQSDFLASALQIFAARAASELERKDADIRIHEQASLLDKAQDAIVVRAVDDRVLYWNKGAERLYGWTRDEVLGRTMTELIAHEPAASARATAKVLRLGEWSGDLTQVRKDGNRFSIEGHWTLIEDEHGAPKSIFEINTDITDRKLAEEKILQLAFYDALTRLPNRILLLERLQEALLAANRSGQTGALLFIDLDNFKALNDTLGHDVGDALLRKVTHRLVSCVRESDTVARLGGDEFVVLLENLGSGAQEAALAARVAGEKIIAALNEGYQLGDFLHNSTASLGITLFSNNLDSVGELLKRADLAMYQAKAAGRNTLRFFDPEMQQLVSVRVEMESDLRLALAQQEFALHYQPQVDDEGKVFGAEALIRWHHPQRGMVSPFDFISVAEETGLILPIGHWVMQTACAQLVEWARRPQTRDLVLAVNVSARQFRQPDFVDQVLAVLAASGADPTRLKIELTESLLVDNLDETIENMSTLKECGVGFSLDDFGTGYSSLAYLKRLPLDQLKIDQSFVRDILHDPNDAAIARTIVALAQSLGLSVIAEGVETAEQRSFLAASGCPTYQGYLFSKPLPVAQFEQYLAERNQHPLPVTT